MESQRVGHDWAAFTFTSYSRKYPSYILGARPLLDVWFEDASSQFPVCLSILLVVSLKAKVVILLSWINLFQGLAFAFGVMSKKSVTQSHKDFFFLMFSSMFLDFTFRSMTTCELIFIFEMRCRSRFIFFLTDAYPIVPTLFVGMTILSLPNCPCILVKSQLSVTCRLLRAASAALPACLLTLMLAHCWCTAPAFLIFKGVSMF